MSKVLFGKSLRSSKMFPAEVLEAAGSLLWRNYCRYGITTITSHLHPLYCKRDRQKHTLYSSNFSSLPSFAPFGSFSFAYTIFSSLYFIYDSNDVTCFILGIETDIVRKQKFVFVTKIMTWLDEN